MNALVAVGDATGDGTPDLYARDRGTNIAYLYPGTGTGTGALGTRRSLGYSWGQNAYAGIENHSTENDWVAILGRNPDGGLFAEWFRGDGSIDTGTVPISQGWGSTPSPADGGATQARRHGGTGCPDVAPRQDS